MIFTDRTITVRKGESRIDEPIVVYRGDYELEVRFTILNSRFKFMSGTNMIESEKASYGQLAILTPYGGNIFSDIVRCNDGSVTFVLTADMLNQIEEVGLYSFQIRLMDYNKESRVSIPPIEFGIEVREPIASEDHDNSVNNAIVGYSIAKVVDPKEENVGDTFDESGNYNKTKWETGDRISEGKLNKIEDAIDKVNRNGINDKNALDKQMMSNFNVLQNQIDNMVIESGNTDIEVEQARGEYDLLNQRLNAMDEQDAQLSSQLTHIAIDVMSYGAKGDGTTDDSLAIQNAIDSLPYDDNLKIVIFPQGHIFNCNVVVSIPHLVLTGGGTITGKLLIDVVNSYANLHIKDLSFKDGGCVEYRTCRGGSLSRCTFDHTDVAIKMKANEENEGQSIARLRIEHNSFESTNYDLLCHSVENNVMSIADIHFINNMCKYANISHIDIATMDGAVITGNTFFCNRGLETYHHIIVREWSNWFIVNNNNLFESGHESVYLAGSENYNISNNNFAWCGRYVRCAAIKIEGLETDHASYGTINGNNINVPSNTGVEVINSSYVIIKDNMIALSEIQTGFKGTEPINLEKFYGVYTDDISKAVSVDNLINMPNRHRNPSSVHFRINEHYYVDLDAVTSIDGNYDEIRIKGDSTIETIYNGFTGHVVRIYVLASSVIIKNNSTIFLRGGVDAKLKRRDIIELMYKDGVWIEKSRNEMTKSNTKYLRHSDNETLSVLNDEGIVVLENTADIPITSIKGSYIGQQITIISTGNLNKVGHNINLKNKDATTVLIPNGRSITFVNYYDTWYEVGRSF